MAASEESGLQTALSDGQAAAGSACMVLTARQLLEIVRNAVARALRPHKLPDMGTPDSMSTQVVKDLGSTEDFKDFGSTDCVRDKTKSALRKEFYSMRQNPGETFQHYETTLHRKAAHCDFFVRCSNAKCGQIVSYADQMVSDQLLVSSEDSDIEDGVLAQEAHLGTFQEKSDRSESLEKADPVKRLFHVEQNTEHAAHMAPESKTKKLRIVGLACGEERPAFPVQMLVVRSSRGLTGPRAQTFTAKSPQYPPLCGIKKENTDEGSVDLTPSLGSGQVSYVLTSTTNSSANQDQFSDSIASQNLTTGQDKKLRSVNKNQCKICKVSCGTQEELTGHMRIHTGEKPYECVECGMRFFQSRELIRHMGTHRRMRMKNGEKPYKCSECGKGFNSSTSLQYHTKTHTVEKPLKCEECGKYFITQNHLTIHMRIHTGEKPYKCSECGMGFYQRLPMVMHVRNHRRMRIQNGEKPYKCSECEKSFSKSSNLKTHREIHTGEKKFKCWKCGRYFITQSALATHKIIHSGEKPYKCTVCEKSFDKNAALTIHFRIHTGEKPFTCDECGKCFRCISAFNSHKKNPHWRKLTHM